MATLLILKVGSAVDEVVQRRGDFEVLFLEGMGLPASAARVVEPHRGEALPRPEDHRAVVVTGSSAMVTEEAGWSLACEEWLRAAVAGEGAVLGVCYGHQLLARALGGSAGWNPNGREIGSIDVAALPAASADPLFGALPPALVCQASHSQSVTALPPGAVHLATNDHDPFQAFSYGPRAWGLQFHPEFDAEVVAGYIRTRRDALVEEGLDPDALLASTRDADHGRAFLTGFARAFELAD